jgi:hypothetical protein
MWRLATTDGAERWSMGDGRPKLVGSAADDLNEESRKKDVFEQQFRQVPGYYPPFHGCEPVA